MLADSLAIPALLPMPMLNQSHAQVGFAAFVAYELYQEAQDERHRMEQPHRSGHSRRKRREKHPSSPPRAEEKRWLGALSPLDDDERDQAEKAAFASSLEKDVSQDGLVKRRTVSVACSSASHLPRADLERGCVKTREFTHRQDQMDSLPSSSEQLFLAPYVKRNDSSASSTSSGAQEPAALAPPGSLGPVGSSTPSESGASNISQPETSLPVENKARLKKTPMGAQQELDSVCSHVPFEVAYRSSPHFLEPAELVPEAQSLAHPRASTSARSATTGESSFISQTSSMHQPSERPLASDSDSESGQSEPLLIEHPTHFDEDDGVQSISSSSSAQSQIEENLGQHDMDTASESWSSLGDEASSDEEIAQGSWSDNRGGSRAQPAAAGSVAA